MTTNTKAVEYLGDLFGRAEKAEAELGAQAAYQGLLLATVSVALRHSSPQQVAAWLEKTARDIQSRGAQ
jgi:hypothetical protein